VKVTKMQSKEDEVVVSQPRADSRPESGSDGAFEFDMWASDVGLSRKTTHVLRQEELITKESLRLLEVKDAKEFGFPLGQQKLLMAAVSALQPPAIANNPAPNTPPENPLSMQEAGPAAEILTLPDLRHQQAGLDNAGRRLDELLGACVVSTATQSVKCSDTFLDPRSILTMKAQTRKAVHVTSFLSEKAKRRRQNRRRDLVLKTGGDQYDRVVIQTDDDHPYAGVYIEEWGAANCRVMNHLLTGNQLRREDVEYYLAYSTKIFEFAEKYEWSSVLDYDFHYRELQAEHQFAWGTFSPHMELQLLTPKRRMGQTAPPSAPAANGYVRSSVKTDDCRHFKARSWCPFGDTCKFKHVRASGPDNRQNEAPVSKN
jgi:hypothetical protein